jgi:23S rRNA (adenine2030-N6)-methyltransferase
MNYRHIYHAGNFADIIKHLTLVGILKRLKIKENPFCVLDAFAGVGLYNLNDERVAKTNEASEGILKLYNYESKMPELIKLYLDQVKFYNEQDLNIYPGSPAIIGDLLRPQDRLIACELHQEDFAELKQNFTLEDNIKIHHIDAYNAIKAFMPPLENRGLVFLDPPFEKNDEFEKLINAAKLLKKRFLAGITLIWFPIKDVQKIQYFYNDFLSVGYKESLVIEFSVKKSKNDILEDNKLLKTGLIIANPPWKLKEDLEQSLRFLQEKIFLGAKYNITELNN